MQNVPQLATPHTKGFPLEFEVKMDKDLKAILSTAFGASIFALTLWLFDAPVWAIVGLAVLYAQIRWWFWLFRK